MTPRIARHFVRFALLAFAVLALETIPAALAHAQESSRPQLTESQKRQTTLHYDKATRYYNVGKYAEAIGEYEAAYLISADPVMLFNIAQCHRLGGQSEEAARFYKNYLRNAPNAPNRGEVEKKIAEMDKQTDDRRRSGTPPSTVASAPTVPPPAPIVSPATSPTLPVVAPAAQVPPPESPAAMVTGGNRPSAAATPSSSRFWPTALMIGGGTLVATSIIFGGIAVSKAKKVEDLASTQTATFDDNAKKLQDQGKAASGVAVLTGLVGIAAGVTGFVLWTQVKAKTGEPARATSSIFPLLGPGLAGAGAHLTF